MWNLSICFGSLWNCFLSDLIGVPLFLSDPLPYLLLSGLITIHPCDYRRINTLGGQSVYLCRPVRLLACFLASHVSSRD